MAQSPITLTDSQRDTLLKAVRENIAVNSGRGSSQYVTETILSRHDRFGSSPVQINSEMVGLTFFTKPRLNMTTTSLRQDPQLALMDTLDPLSLMFALRCNLDTEFMRNGVGKDIADSSPWVNPHTPFNIPLSNTIVGMSGWPDFNLEYETTEPGYFSEDMTLARGSDRGRRTYDISCTFRDIQGGYIMAYFYYWIHMMALQMEGITVAYPEDREANRLNYTVSIYRFILDPHMKTITKWAKGTGCYPVSLPIGDVFNFSPGDSFIHTSQQFTIPFKVNNVAYMDPRHLAAFNTLVERYNDKNIGTISGDNVKVPVSAGTNFIGVPYIDIKNGTNELMYMAKKADLVDSSQKTIDDIMASFKSVTESSLTDKYTTTDPLGTATTTTP